MFGVEKSQRPAQNKNALEAFLYPLGVVEFGYDAAVEYGKLRAYLQRQGTPIGTVDTFIAAHALQLGIPLVTNNEREFSRVPGLRIENWVSA
jgi:tRNA(fMet)-specific endonuclease VapC